MQKSLILLTLICVLCTTSLLAQTNCSNFYLTPDYDTQATPFVDVHESLPFLRSYSTPIVYSNIVAPPGFTFYPGAVAFYGQAETAGTHEFGFLATATATGCTFTVQEFRTYVQSPTQICEQILIRSNWVSGTEHYVGDSIKMHFFVTDGGEDPPFTFYAFDLREGATFDSLGNYRDFASREELFSFRVIAKDNVGCISDTLTYESSTECYKPHPTSVQILPPAEVGKYFEHQLDGTATRMFPPYSNFNSFGPLAPGLNVSVGGLVYGTPTATVPPNYSREVQYTGLGGCPAKKSVRTTINPATSTCQPVNIETTWVSGVEHWVGDSIRMHFYVGSPGNSAYKFDGLDLRAGATLDSLGNYKDYASEPTDFSFKVVAIDQDGCTSTLRYEIFTHCPHTFPSWQSMTFTKGQYFEQNVATDYQLHPPFTDFIAFNPLPPGLTLSSDGVVSGTPTIAGVYNNVQTSHKGLGGCAGVTYLDITIKESQPVQSLWITPVCAQSLDERNWVVHNPNPFPINVSWTRLYASGNFGAFIAQPGDNDFSIPDGGWPNSIRISWFDHNNVQRSIVQASNDNQCTPPECAWIDGVTFYHQGRQADGSAIPGHQSWASTVLGTPDANDAPNSDAKAFSLGYYGFITVQLTADVYDQPGADLKVWEHSLGDPVYGHYQERAEVFVSTNNQTWISLGYTNPTEQCRAKLDWEFDIAGKATWFRYVKVVDVTPRWAQHLDPITCNWTGNYSFDGTSNGFDLDAITCANYSGENNVAGRMAADETTVENYAMLERNSNELVAYPNPATSVLTLDFTREPEFIYPDGGQVEVSIIDMSGKINARGLHRLDNEWKTQVNVDRLTPGVFVAQVKTNGLTKYYKFMRN